MTTDIQLMNAIDHSMERSSFEELCEVDGLMDEAMSYLDDMGWSGFDYMNPFAIQLAMQDILECRAAGAVDMEAEFGY